MVDCTISNGGERVYLRLSLSKKYAYSRWNMLLRTLISAASFLDSLSVFVSADSAQCARFVILEILNHTN